METFKNIFYGIYIVVCIYLILITFFQASEAQNSVEDSFENTRTNKFFEKNKSRKRSGRLQRRTIILGIVFAVLTIAMSFVTVL